ncbi:unnamed protein product, partial [Didymodactylos carnosus]
MEDIDTDLNEGLQYARDKQYQKAIEKFDKSLTNKSPGTLIHDVSYFRGCAKIKLGQYEQAIKDFDSAIDGKSSKYGDALYKRAYAKHLIGQYDMALRDYELFVAQCKATDTDLLAKGRFSMGCAYLYLNENDKALACFDQAVTSKPDRAEYRLYRGRAYGTLGLYNDAIQDLERVCSQCSDAYLVGLAQNELGNHIEAIKSYNTALENNLHNSDALFRRGLSHACLDDHLQAIQDFQQAIKESERPDRIHFRLGISNIALNDHKGAILNFKEAQKLAPYHADVYYARGMLHYNLGRHNAAIHDKRKALLLEQVAPYKKNPDETHESAQEYYDQAKRLDQEQHGSQIKPDAYVRTALNDLYSAEKIAHRCTDPTKALRNDIENYVNKQLSAIENLSQAFHGNLEKLSAFINSQQNFNNFERPLSQREAAKAEALAILKHKVDMMKETEDEFEGSEVQQQYYRSLCISLCNVFDSSRIVSSAMVSHCLTGALSTGAQGLKWGFEIIKRVVNHFTSLPGGATVEQVAGGVVSGLKKWDAHRITNALNVIGKLDTPQKFHEAANYISRQLTIIYKCQLEQCVLSQRKDSIKSTSSVQQVKTNCCTCMKVTVDIVLNRERKTSIQKVAEYATSLILDKIKTFDVTTLPTEAGCCDCLLRRKGNKINDGQPVGPPKSLEELNEKLIDAVCNTTGKPIISTVLGTDKLKLARTNPETPEAKRVWRIYEFYQKP